MAYVICEPCYDCKYTDCVEVCPVDCFYQGDHQLYIHPDECIDCGACVAECPVEAIFPEADVPEKWKNYIQLNRDKAPQFPQITQKQESLAGKTSKACK
jgi:ferredoxin